LRCKLPGVDLFLVVGRRGSACRFMDGRCRSCASTFACIARQQCERVPVGMLYEGKYHTVVIAPATSNTVAKCAFGISDTLPTNLYAQAGKQCIPGIVFACDTEPSVITQSPHEWVELRPRSDRTRQRRALVALIEYTTVARSLDELKAALDQRLSTLGLAWTTSSS
jgi:dihydromethanopterin reductase (acceptor)